MPARDYFPLLADGSTIVRTLRQKYGAPDPGLVSPYTPGEPLRLVAGVHPARLEVVVARTRDEGPGVRTLVLAPASGDLPPFLPGQYVNVFVEVAGVQTSRPMSISSLPRQDQELELTVKRMPGGFVSAYLVEQVQVGDRLTISGPEGDFHHAPVRDGDDLVFIAGGSGITPFVAMAEQLLSARPEARILLLYGSRDPSQVIFGQRLRQLADQHPRLELVLTVEQADDSWDGEQGALDGALLRRHLGSRELARQTAFVCGPPAMQAAVVSDLVALGLSRARIRVEASGPAPDLAQLPGWPAALAPKQAFELRLEGTDQVVEASAGEPLLNALERAGHQVPALCRSGSCGSCRTRLVSGQVAGPDTGLRLSDHAAGYIHACVCHPTSDLTVRVATARRSSSGAAATPAAPEQPAPVAAEAIRPPPQATEAPAAGRSRLKIALAMGGLGVLVVLVALLSMTF